MVFSATFAVRVLAIFCAACTLSLASSLDMAKDNLGKPLNTAEGTLKGSNGLHFRSDMRSTVELGASALGDAADISRTFGILNGVNSQPIAITRGAKESAIYSRISPSVVLVMTGDSLGSGSVVSNDGLVLTNYHVVGDSKQVGIIYKPIVEGAAISRANLVRGTVIKVDQVADLALIRVEAPRASTTPIKFGSLSDLQVGADVHAIGHPTGEAWTYTRGIVSQIRKGYEWKTDELYLHHADVVQTQTPINPGNSGGPLLNDAGDLIGVNSFKSEGEGLNFAIAVDEVQRFYDSPNNRYAVALQKKAPAGANAAAGKQCKPREVGHRHADDPPSKVTELDLNCSGKADAEYYEPDDESQPNMMFIDSKDMGKIDVILVDNGRKGWFDIALYDTVGDGKPHLIGYFKKGADKPYKVEPYSKSVG